MEHPVTVRSGRRNTCKSALKEGSGPRSTYSGGASGGRPPAVPLRAAPPRPPALALAAVTLVTFVWFAASNGGFDGTTWLPGSLIVLALVVIAVLTVPATAVPRLVEGAGGA